MYSALLQQQFRKEGEAIALSYAAVVLNTFKASAAVARSSEVAPSYHLIKNNDHNSSRINNRNKIITLAAESGSIEGPLIRYAQLYFQELLMDQLDGLLKLMYQRRPGQSCQCHYSSHLRHDRLSSGLA